VSASSPETLAKQAFGILFNARMDGSRLYMEARLHPARAHAVGLAAVRVIERMQARCPLSWEASTGSWLCPHRGSFLGHG